MAAKCEEIRYCRIDSMYDEKYRRITLCVEQTGIREVLLQLLQAPPISAELNQGKAPCTHMARELQDWLELLMKTDR